MKSLLPLVYLRYLLVCASVITLPVFAAVPAGAAGFTVTNLNDNGSGSLRAAIAAAAAGDNINFGVTGTIKLTSGELKISRNLTITGPAGGITIDPNYTSRIFNITAGTVVIDRLAMTHGHAAGSPARGGAIRNNGNLTLRNSTLSANRAGPGDMGSASSAEGGGVYNEGAMTLLNCTVAQNAAIGSDAAFFPENTPDVAGNAQGGGIGNYGSMTLINCSLSGNMAQAGNTPDDSDVPGNAQGGGIANLGSLGLTNCTVSSNNAISTATNNPVPTQGGGLYLNFNGQATFRNTIVAVNFANPPFSGASHDIEGPVSSQGHNLIGVADASPGWTPTDLTGSSAIPLNPRLAPLRANGGPTQTMALGGDSPALDAGDDAVLGAPFNLTTDQRGSGFPRRVGSHVDIGAVEFTPQIGSVFTVTITDDRNTGKCGVGNCSLREAIGAANTASGGQTVQFASWVLGIIRLTAGELALTDTLLVQGPGATALTIDGNQTNRIFRIDTAGLAVTIADLTLTNGVVRGASPLGGAVSNNGNLTVRNCLLTLNQAAGGSGLAARGGAIFNSGALSLTACTLSRNDATGGDGAGSGSQRGGDGQGGAVYSSGTLNMTNCTVNGNIARGGMGAGSSSFSGGDGGNGEGGGMWSSGTFNLHSCTISSNAAFAGWGGAGSPYGSDGFSQGGGIFHSGAGGSSLRNTLAASNAAFNGGPEAFGSFTSQGYNLISKADGSSGFGVAGDQTGTAANPLDAKLGPLQYNGGPTSTQELQSGSPALDKGRSFGLTTDQRAYLRPYDDPGVPNAAGGDGSDIGACEVAPPIILQFASATFSVSESSTNATITVTRTGGMTGSATLYYVTSDGSAIAGSDYYSASGTLTFAPNQTTKTFVVGIIKAPNCEPIESLNLFLYGYSAGASLGTPSTATLSIYDTDCSYTINGRVTNSNGTAMPNIQITRTGVPSGSGANAITNGTGNFTFTGVKQGAYTIAPLITPGLSGISFNPPSYNVTVNTSSLNNISFTAFFTITGKVSNSTGAGIPNIQVTRKTSTTSVTAVTNVSGIYTFAGVRSGSYSIAPVVTPSMTGISFFPVSTNVTVTTGNLGNINFTAFFSISGRVTNSAGTGISNVLVTRSTSGSSTSVVTNANGNYTFTGVRSGTYTITPSQSGKVFSPTSRSVTVGSASLTNLNFIGS